MATVYDFLNPDSTEVEEQRIISAPGAAPGDVLTVAANGTVSPAPGGGSQAVLRSVKNLVAADLVALDETPFELVAAPGPGNFIMPFSVHFITTPAGTTPYALTGPPSFTFTTHTYGNPANFLNEALNAGFILTDPVAVNYFALFMGGANSGIEGLAPLNQIGDGEALLLALDGAGALADGDGGLRVVTFYAVISAS